MKQTAIEWLFDNLIELNADMKYNIIDWETYLSKRADLLEQAKAMEKEHLYNFYMQGGVDAIMEADRNVEQYYNETFKSE